MRRVAALIIAVSIVAGLLATRACSAVEAITLRVALYPFVPDRRAVFTLLAQEFQKKNPGVVLESVEVPADQNYYNGGLAALDADVYEIDSILLSDMLDKIAPLSISLEGFEPAAIEAVTRNGAVYAVPHWMCGNFLFYRKDNIAVRDAATWTDLATVLSGQRKALMVDLFGRLTLGEWYITALADRIGMNAAQSAILSSNAPDPQVIASLNTILSACPTGACRSEDFHDRAGFYARAFIRGEAAAYVGYSETLYYALKESIDNCRIGSPCLSPNEVAVRRLPKLAKGSTGEGVGWVDGLAISNKMDATKRAVALKFIQFATSGEAYKLVLTPEFMEAPRYLLPARAGLPVGNETPLYPELIAAHAGRKTGTAPGLNQKLRSLAKTLTCKLPIDRTDTSTAKDCPIQ